MKTLEELGFELADIIFDIGDEFVDMINDIGEICEDLPELLEGDWENVKEARDINMLISEFDAEEELLEEELELGDHLYALRLGYTHHGIYIGDGQVIHYLAEQVKIDTVKTFGAGFRICKKELWESYTSYEAEEIVERARSRMGEMEYHLLFNNCEQFCRWCRCGE